MKTLSRYYPHIITILIIICIYLFYYCWYVESPVTQIFLVRHADRTGSIDSLNTNGFDRANELVRVLDEANIEAIYASTANRTQQTAEPLATQLGIGIEVYDPFNLAALAEDITANHKGEVILVVGHSNTVPETIGFIGVSPVPPEIPHNEYDHVYLVTLGDHAITKLIKMEYSADMP